MIEQLKIIRDFFKLPVPHSQQDLGEYIIEHIIEQRKALTALAQLEVMAEQEPVHWRAVLDPEQVPQQVKTTMHVVGFREKKAAEGFVAEQIDFYGWRYTIEPLYATPVAQQPQNKTPWQPIETAPTELGAQYLVYTPGAMYPYDVCRNMNDFRIIGNTFDFDRREQPTMWMPITPAIKALK